MLNRGYLLRLQALGYGLQGDCRFGCVPGATNYRDLWQLTAVRGQKQVVLLEAVTWREYLGSVQLWLALRSETPERMAA